ncbi:hypothetical protein PFISCL1PPCAC_26833 [Pristionchus fissidentatus]|uniref:Protein kinase domain-containing protein n=1 Tax=Pristionchus fissidentatus TaxID=1538716 RepID=A0AAV5WTC5_9BILA|nr:hypothetical protein PFISCL1PPCAC_26833 [Pristionchus fissidentatus]
MFGRLKSLFKAPNGEDAKRIQLPPIVQAGQSHLDEWDIVGELGDGAFGKVEKAVHRADNRRIAAAKCITIEEGEELEDFLVEINILTACSHPNIVGLYACYYMDHKLSMLLEYCGGGAVDGIMIELEKPLTEPQIAYIARFTCEALAYLHEQNVIHRDLKAGNILLTSDAVVKLADFGVSAKLRDRAEKRDTFIGTPYWMAPEVMACETFKDQPYDTRSDIWSFGITLIELAQMEPPHSEVSPMRVLIKVQKSDPPKLSIPDAWSLFFNDFLAQCLIKSPANRRNATQLRSHPFLRSGTDKKSVETLLAEVNADVREEEIVIDDSESVADSEDMQDESQENIPPMEEVSFEKRQKRAAPPPPVSPIHTSHEVTIVKTPSTATADITLNTVTEPKRIDTNLNVLNEVRSPKSPQSSDVVDALRELDTALSSEATFITISPEAKDEPAEPAYYSPALPRRPEVIEATNKIKHVLDSVRARSVDRSPLPQSRTPSRPSRPDTALSTDSDSGYVPEAKPSVVHNCDADFSLHNGDQLESTEHTHSIPIHESESLSGVSALRERFESPQRTSSSSGRVSRSTSVTRDSTDESDAEAIARARIRNAIQHQINLEANRVSSQSIQSTRPLPSRAAASSTVTMVQSADRVSIASASEFNASRLHDQLNSTPPHHQIEVKRSPSKKEYAYFENLDQPSSDYFAESQLDSTRPPPDPPVDYEEKRAKKSEKRREEPVVISASSTLSKESKDSSTPSEAHTIEPPVKIRAQTVVKDDKPVFKRNPYRQTVTKKTRTYVVDGVEVTSTTMHVLGRQQNLQLRRQEMQELKRVQREESRQIQELESQASHQNELQEKKQQQEKSTMHRQYELDMDSLMRKQKREIEDAERLQEEELRTTNKRLKYEQEKDLHAFKERLKQEMKIMKQEVEMLPRAQRKDALKQRKEIAEEMNLQKEQDFIVQLRMNAEASIGRMRAKHKEKIAQLERQFLEQKHMLLRAKEGSEWELEDKVMSERYVLHRRLLKDKFFLLRTQMLARQQKELQQAQKLHAREEEELIRALATDRKRLPKMLRNEAKTRSAMYKESLRISMADPNGGDINDLVRRFDEAEKARVNQALKDHEMKSEKKIQSLKEKNAMEMKELEEAQNDNRKLLLEKERQTLQEHENKYMGMKDEWKNDLPRKKLELETLFDSELADQEHFYGMQSSTPSTPSMGRGRI